MNPRERREKVLALLAGEPGRIENAHVEARFPRRSNSWLDDLCAAEPTYRVYVPASGSLSAEDGFPIPPGVDVYGDGEGYWYPPEAIGDEWVTHESADLVRMTARANHAPTTVANGHQERIDAMNLRTQINGVFGDAEARALLNTHFAWGIPSPDHDKEEEDVRELAREILDTLAQAPDVDCVTVENGEIAWMGEQRYAKKS